MNRQEREAVSMRERRVNLDQFGIDKWEYQELRALCRQYDQKRLELESALAISSPSMDGSPHGGGGINKPVENAALRRERLLEDVRIIEEAARETSGGTWRAAMIESCCRGVGYDSIPFHMLPTSNRSAFFKARREFFYRLRALRYPDS